MDGIESNSAAGEEIFNDGNAVKTKEKQALLNLGGRLQCNIALQNLVEIAD